MSDQSKIELERMKGEMDAHSKKELEYIKAEIALFANTATTAADREKALHMTVANVRATSYPKLVSLLRRMKRQFEGLALATEAEQGGPVNLSRKSKRAELVRKAMTELAQLEQEFDDELSSVRLFTTRSDYALQSLVKSFCNEWDNKSGMFSVTKEYLHTVISDYNDDISYLSEEFYKPEIPSAQSGELLGHASMFGKLDGDIDAAIKELEAVADVKPGKPMFSKWLVSRRPGSPMVRKS